MIENYLLEELVTFQRMGTLKKRPPTWPSPNQP